MPDEIAWPTPEEEEILDRVNDSVAQPTPKERAETARRSEAARQYRLRLEADRKAKPPVS